MFEELRVAVMGARARGAAPGVLTAADALELATLGGARALGLQDEVGSLREGKWADLCVLSLEDSPFDPLEDPVIAAILGGSPARVAATLLAGDERYAKGTTDWRDLRRAGQSARGRMLR
jgi:5-methylthioadenosine/S-adenosylhomocysteine deaminase